MRAKERPPAHQPTRQQRVASGKRRGEHQRGQQRQRTAQPTTPTVTSRLTYRVVCLQDAAADLANRVAVVAHTRDDWRWAAAATYLVTAAGAIWQAVDVLGPPECESERAS